MPSPYESRRIGFLGIERHWREFDEVRLTFGQVKWRIKEKYF